MVPFCHFQAFPFILCSVPSGGSFPAAYILEADRGDSPFQTNLLRPRPMRLWIWIRLVHRARNYLEAPSRLPPTGVRVCSWVGCARTKSSYDIIWKKPTIVFPFPWLSAGTFVSPLSAKLVWQRLFDLTRTPCPIQNMKPFTPGDRDLSFGFPFSLPFLFPFPFPPSVEYCY